MVVVLKVCEVRSYVLRMRIRCVEPTGVQAAEAQAFSSQPLSSAPVDLSVVIARSIKDS
jgi:hypothetical protein